MEIKYYGTSAGGGIPEIFCDCRICRHAREMRGKNIRSRSQAVIDRRLSIDYPVDVFMHSAYGGLDMRSVRHILVTHSHQDHFLLKDVFSRYQGSDQPIRFYMSAQSGAELKEKIEKREAAYAAGKPRTDSCRVEVEFLSMYTPKEILDYTVTPLRARHAESIGSMIYLISSHTDRKNILWAHDTGKFHPDAIDYLKSSEVKLDFVSLDCALKRGAQITTAHMDIDWCKEMADLLRENGNVTENTTVALSHIGHLVERTHDELAQDAAELGMIVAYDGFTVNI